MSNNGLIAVCVVAGLGFFGLCVFGIMKDVEHKHEEKIAHIEAGTLPEAEPEEPHVIRVDPLPDHGPVSSIEVVKKPEPVPEGPPPKPSAREIEIAVDHFYRHQLEDSHFVDAAQLTDVEKSHMLSADYILLVDERQLVGLKFSGSTETPESTPIIDELIALYGEYPAVVDYAAKQYNTVSTPTIDGLREQIEEKRRELRRLGVRLKMWNSGVSKETVRTVLGE